jgi:undecaprenyl-diphosphatase
VFVGLTWLGWRGLVWVALAPLVAWRAGYPLLRATLIVAGSVWATELLASLVKEAVDRPRPFTTIPEADPLIGVASPSFPSGHAATSAAGAFALALIAPRLWPWLAALAVGVAFSRVYVGVHYPADVLAGIALGLAVTGGIWVAVRRLRPISAGPRPPAAPPPSG